MGDNHNPFKGPFKGKGENRKALRELEIEMGEIRDEMNALTARFDETFRPPRPINLRLSRRQSYLMLWWRMPGRSGTFIRLFDNEKGLKVLASLLPETRRVFVGFDKERIRLNFRGSVVGHAIDNYVRRERDLAILEQYESGEC